MEPAIAVRHLGSIPSRRKHTFSSIDQQTTNQMEKESFSSYPNTLSPVPLNNLISAPVFGTVIPNCVFVGGIDFQTNENDLRMFFAHYGTVKGVKIVNDRAGVSKGYGFITFETQEDAQMILRDAEKLKYKDRKLNIGPAIRKQKIRSPRSPVTPEAGSMYFTSSGYPYIYCNGLAYFHMPEVASVQQPWPSCPVSSSPVMAAQPVYQSPTYYYQAPTQCLPSQWSVPQSPASSLSFLYVQPSEAIYQPTGIAQLYSDHVVQAPLYQPCAQSAIAMPTPLSEVFFFLLLSLICMFSLYLTQWSIQY